MKADNSKLLAIQKLIITMLVIIFSIPISFSIQKTTVHASSFEEAAASWAESVVNMSSGGGASGAGSNGYPNGVRDNRQAYLVYMVDKSGNQVTPNKVFKLENNSYISGTNSKIISRKGITTTSQDSGIAKWGAPWTCVGDDVVKNDEHIKDWFVRYGHDFVADNFPNSLTAFENDEQFIVIEIMMNFQYSQGRELTAAQIASCSRNARSVVNNMTDANMARIFGVPYLSVAHLTREKAEEILYESLRDKLIERTQENLAGQRELIGEPIMAPIHVLVDYRKNNIYDRYLFNIACFSEKIETNECGYTAWTGRTDERFRMTASQVKTYGVGMFIVHCHDTLLAGQSTSDSSSQPHQAPKESTGTAKIVKTYISSTAPTSNPNNKTYKFEGNHITTDVSSTITIEDETSTTGYKLMNWVVSTELNENINPISSNHIVWSSRIPGTKLAQGTSPSTETIPESSVLYLLLEKDSNTQVEAYDFKVSQSHLTKRVRFSEAVKTQPLLGVNFTWSSSAHNTSCGGHSYHCSGCGTRPSSDGLSVVPFCPGHTAYCSGGGMADTSVNFSLVNSLIGNNPNILVNTNNANFKDYIAKDTTSLHKYTASHTRPGSGADSWSKSGWDYVCVLYRGQDKPTIAEFKNTCNTLVNIGFPQGNTPSGSRKDADYMEAFNAKIVDQPSTDHSTYYKFTGSEHGDCSNSRSYNCSTSWAVNNVKVLVEVYNGASISPTVPALKKNQVADDAITFYPYVRMQYDTVNSTQNVYVLGRYPRTLNTTSYALIRTDKDTKTNNHLELYSSQWSTHTTINENLSVALNNTDLQKIIPGGAIVSIQNKEATGKSIVLETYQCYLTGNGKTQVQKTGTVPSSMDGDTIPKQNHRDTVNSVIEGIKGINLQMYGQTSITGSFQQIKPGSTFKQLTSTGGTEDRLLNTDSKYYWNNFSETYLDAVEKDTSEDRYTFSTDTNGNILMNGSVILSKGSSLSSLSGDAKKINAYTHVVDQLYTQLERDTGYDEESTWGAIWYNEAFDGITVLVSKTRLNIGYFNPTERQSVIDPKLSVVQSGKNTMTEKLTSQSEAKKRFDAFYLKTSKQSSVYNIDNQIAEFRGTQLYTNENEYSPSDEIDLDEILSTDIFYTTTQTTQDLK